MILLGILAVLSVCEILASFAFYAILCSFFGFSILLNVVIVLINDVGSALHEKKSIPSANGEPRDADEEQFLYNVEDRNGDKPMKKLRKAWAKYRSGPDYSICDLYDSYHRELEKCGAEGQEEVQSKISLFFQKHFPPCRQKTRSRKHSL